MVWNYCLSTTKTSSSVSALNTTSASVEIVSKDLNEEVVGIKNNGNEAVSLKDWQLISIEGNQVFNFPNVTLQPGKTIYVTSGSNAREGQNYLKWTKKQIWLNDGDAAQLRNAKGNLLVSSTKYTLDRIEDGYAVFEVPKGRGTANHFAVCHE